MITTTVLNGTKPNETYYVALYDGEEIARVRIPSHLVYIEDPERQAFLFRQVQEGLAKKVHDLGYRATDMKKESP